MEIQNRTIPVPETMPVGLLLAFVGGYLDAYTYLLHGGVFANAQTGNMVLLFISLAEGEWTKAGYYVIPIVAFALGIFVTDILKRRFVTARNVHWRQISVLAEFFILIIIGSLPAAIPDGIVNITVSFVCAVQVASFSRLHGMGYATTMCTNNLRQAVENGASYRIDKDKAAGSRARKYLAVIAVFCLGALVCARAVRVFGNRSIFLCCLPLLGVWLCLFAGRDQAAL
ncbi:MAG TPA: YoaK family protein [Feifaniaceae bacterium]|nr:YoaK family protein [Feifaniaceae bacterium]